jgi:hypothetical protein
VRTYYPIELGNGANFVNVDKTFFLGHRVERFRVKFRVINPGRTANWPAGLTLRLGPNGGVSENFPSGQPPQLPPMEPDGSFWSREFPTNFLTIKVGSGPASIGFDGGAPRVEIVAVERHILPGVDRNDLPTASTGARRNALTLEQGEETIAFTPGIDEALHFRIPGPSVPRTQSLYISPRSVTLNNSVSLRVHLSTRGFVGPDTNTSWLEPAPGDTGIYTEFTTPQGQDMFATVVASAMAPSLIRHASVVEGFENIVMERDAQMLDAPDINVSAIRGSVNEQNPFNGQIADYLLPTKADFNRRIRETLTIATAYALDASDGQLRFASADLHQNISPTRNVDIQFSVCRNTPCRANAGFTRISMFDTDVMTDPQGAGRVFHHEWGHWEYGLPDEYLDVTGPPPVMFSDAIDPNSLMGTDGSTEFCTANNHLWAPGAVGAEDSCWTQLMAQYQSVTLGPAPFPSLSHARYLDVLHKLEGLVRLRLR